MRLFHFPAHYRYRGEALRGLNRFEYSANVMVEKKLQINYDESHRGRDVNRRYDFGKGHLLQATHTQVIRSKQTIAITCGKSPKPPGKEPTDRNLWHKWKRNADRFAYCYLALFRPEYDLYEDGQDPTLLKYDWETFQQWIDFLIGDDSLTSKLRLQAMFNHIHGTKSKFRTKVMLSEWRNRQRTFWSDDEKRHYATANYLENLAVRNDGEILTNEAFELQHSTIEGRKLDNIRDHWDRGHLVVVPTRHCRCVADELEPAVRPAGQFGSATVEHIDLDRMCRQLSRSERRSSASPDRTTSAEVCSLGHARNATPPRMSRSRRGRGIT